MRPDGAVANAIGQDDGAQIVRYGVDDARAHAARRGATGDQQRVDTVPGEPAGKLGSEEGRRLPFANDEFALNRRHGIDELAEGTGFSELAQTRRFHRKGTGVRTVVGVDDTAMSHRPFPGAGDRQQVSAGGDRVGNIATAKMGRIVEPVHEIDQQQGDALAQAGLLAKTLPRIDVEIGHGTFAPVGLLARSQADTDLVSGQRIGHRKCSVDCATGLLTFEQVDVDIKNEVDTGEW